MIGFLWNPSGSCPTKFDQFLPYIASHATVTLAHSCEYGRLGKVLQDPPRSSDQARIFFCLHTGVTILLMRH